MTQTKISELKDEQKFKVNPNGVTYEINRKEGKYAFCTSESSGRTYSFKLTKEIYPVDICG